MRREPINETEQAMIDYLRNVAALKQHCYQAPSGALYHSVEAFVLAHGVWFDRIDQRRVLPRYAPLGRCFENAGRQALRGKRGLVYVEGFAASFIPIEHAWLTQDGQTALDHTWRLRGDDAPAYFGVAFRREYLRVVTNRTRYWGIFAVRWESPTSADQLSGMLYDFNNQPMETTTNATQTKPARKKAAGKTQQSVSF